MLYKGDVIHYENLYCETEKIFTKVDEDMVVALGCLILDVVFEKLMCKNMS